MGTTSGTYLSFRYLYDFGYLPKFYLALGANSDTYLPKLFLSLGTTSDTYYLSLGTTSSTLPAVWVCQVPRSKVPITDTNPGI